MALLNQTNEQYYEGPDSVWNSFDEDYGGYQFIKIKDLINNFMIAYVGEDKIISKIRRTDVAFHAQRGIQELSFDTLPSTKALEIEIPPTLYMILPQDYVQYVKISWVGQDGIERIIYPTRNTSDPLPVLQDNQYEYLFDENGDIIYAQESETSKRFRDGTTGRGADLENVNNNDILERSGLGRRYGLTPEYAQANGVFYIDQIKGIIHFSGDMIGRVVTLKYISDGLGTEEEMVVHKFAEEAMYKHIAHAILATRANVQEYIVARFKKEAAVARRNAKLRLSSIKLEEITQVMRNKSKQIKH
jgi:hypothetical protein